jgi:urease gamma subunit
LGLTPKEAQKLGMKYRSVLAYLKKKARGGDLNYKSRNVKKIEKAISG